MSLYYDHQNQAWIRNGVYQACGHRDCLERARVFPALAHLRAALKIATDTAALDWLAISVDPQVIASFRDAVEKAPTQMPPDAFCFGTLHQGQRPAQDIVERYNPERRRNATL